MGKIFYHGRFRGDFMGGTQSDEIVAEMLAQRDTVRRAAGRRACLSTSSALSLATCAAEPPTHPAALRVPADERTR